MRNKWSGMQLLVGLVVLACGSLAMGQEWTSWSNDQLGWLLGELRGDESTVVQAREEIYSHIVTDRLGSTADIAQRQPADWARVTQHARKDLEAQVRTLWAERLREAYASTPAAIGNLDGRQFRGLSSALTNLGDPNAGPIAANWVTTRDEWKTWRIPEIIALGRSLRQAGPTGLQARKIVGAHFVTDRLGQAEQVRKTPLVVWEYLAGNFGGLLDLPEQNTWNDRLLAAFASDPEAIAAMTPQQAIRLSRILKDLSSRQIYPVLERWFAASPNVTNASARQLAVLTANMAEAGPPAGQTMTTAESKWQKALQAGQLDWPQASQIAFSWLQNGNRDKAQTWARKAYDLALGTAARRDKAHPGTFLELGTTLQQVGLAGKGQPFPQYAQALADLIERTDGLKRQPYVEKPDRWAAPLTAPESREAIKAVLIDQTGSVRLFVADILCWANRMHGDWQAWQQYVQSQIQTAGDSQTRAQWQIVQARIEQLQPGPVNPLAGVETLQAVLTSEAGEDIRFEAMARLAGAYQNAAAFDQAAAIVQSTSGQFQQSHALELIQLGQQIEQARIQKRRSRRMAQVESAAKVSAARLNFLKRKRAQAVANGDAAQTARYTRLIEEASK